MPAPASAFPETSWTLVLRAAETGDGAAACDDRADAARTALFRAYWTPVYAYLRRRGLAHADAEDQAQTLLARLLSGDGLRGADPARGRFRNYLLRAASNQLINAWQHATAARRDARLALALDALERPVVENLLRDRSDGPDEIFDAAWAHLLLRRALRELGAEWSRRGRGPVFATLRAFLLRKPEDGDYAAPARDLGWKENAVKVEVFRLRARLRARLHEAVAATVADPAEVEDELRHLAAVLARHPLPPEDEP